MIKWIGYNKYKSWFGKVLNMLLIKSIILNDYKKITLETAELHYISFTLNPFYSKRVPSLLTVTNLSAVIF